MNIEEIIAEFFGLIFLCMGIVFIVFEMRAEHKNTNDRVAYGWELLGSGCLAVANFILAAMPGDIVFSIMQYGLGILCCILFGYCWYQVFKKRWLW